MPSTSTFEVGTVFVVKDQASTVIAKIGKAVADLGAEVTGVQEKLAKLGTFRFTGITRNVKKLDDQFAALAATADSTIRNMTTATDAAGVSARTLAAQWRTVQAAASQAAAATQGASRIRVASGGGAGRGNGYGGFGIRGPSGTHLGGGFHAHSGSLIGQGLMAALGYGIVEQSKIEDFAYRATFTAGVPASQMAAIQKAIKTAASQTGASVPDLGEAALDEIRQLGGTGLSWQQKLNVLGPLLTYGAAEGRLKGTSAKEGVDSIIGLAHMLKVYNPKKIAALADKFAFLSTVNPAKLQQMERAAGYAVPMLGELGFDPFQVLSLQTAMMRGGILNTKSGTWLRQLGVRALPGTSVMSRQAFMKHESALAALGLIDSKNDPTWFTSGAPDLVKLLEMASKHLQAMPIAQRAGVMQQLFGAQGSGAAAFLSDPKILKMLPALEADMNRFRSGSALFKNYALNSPTQQFDQAWANLRNVLMDISTVVLPPLTGALQHFDDMLKVLQKILPSSDGAFGKAIGESYGRGLATGNPVEALGGAAWGALKYWWGSSDDQKKATKQGAEEGAKKGVEDGLKHKTSFFGSALGGPVLIPASYSTGGAAYDNGVYYGGGNVAPRGPITTNPGAQPMFHGAAPILPGSTPHPSISGPSVIAAAGPGGMSGNWSNWLAGQSYLETDYRNEGNPTSSAQGYFQFLRGTAADAKRMGIPDPRFGSYAQQAAATKAYIEKTHPAAAAAIARGDYAGASRMLRGVWPSLPGGSQAQNSRRYQTWAQILQSGGPRPPGSASASIAPHGGMPTTSGTGKSLPGSHPFHLTGGLTFNGQTYHFGSGGYKGLPSVPYGTYPINGPSVGAWGSAHGALDINGGKIWDQMLGRNRLGIEMHAGGGSLISEGCIVLPRSEFAKIKPQILKQLSGGNHLFMHVTPHGIDINGDDGTHDDSPSHAIAPGGGNSVTVHHTTKLDGRTIAKSTSKHQARMGNKPSHSSRMSDPYGTSLLSI